MPSDDVDSDAAPVGRSWTDGDSDASFELLGDRLIDATRKFLRSNRRERIQAELYTINGRELSRTQIQALEVIDSEDEVRMSHLAARLRLAPSTVTRTVDPLVKLGLIERFTDTSNRRCVMIRCTGEGADAIARVIDERRRVMRETLAPMEPGRRILLAELLDEYTTLMERGGAGAGDTRDTSQPEPR